MNNNNEDKKIIRDLVKLYFDYNPHMNRGIAFKSKAFDIISSYYNIHKMSKEDIEDCISSQPHCKNPIWIQFSSYYNKNKKSNYKGSVSDSTNPDDYL